MELPEEAAPLQGALHREIVRKLRLAAEADLTADREVICQEIFNDVTGLLEFEVARRLEFANREHAAFWQVLAPYYFGDPTASDTVLFLCKKLWAQPRIPVILTLLLHRWLLLRSEAGGLEQRVKHVSVLAKGARWLLAGDANSSSTRYEPLFKFLAFEITLALDREPLDGLPPEARRAVLSVVASFLPYYCKPALMQELIASFPSPDRPQTAAHVEGEAADFVIAEVALTLMVIRTEQGLLKYLKALCALKGFPHFNTRLGPFTKIRLASDLYNLTSPGGPYYPPKSVQQAANHALDALFPTGRRSRKLWRVFFWCLYPLDWWLARYWAAPLRFGNWCYTRLLQVALAVTAWFLGLMHAAFQNRRIRR